MKNFFQSTTGHKQRVGSSEVNNLLAVVNSQTFTKNTSGEFAPDDIAQHGRTVASV